MKNTTESLNVFNYACAIIFAAVLIVGSSGGGPDALFDFDITEIWREYEESFFSLSDFVMELTSTVVQFFTGVFVVAQMLPSFRSLVPNTTKQAFAAALVGQICWLISMVNEAATLAFLSATATFGAFAFILFNQRKTVNNETSEAYWLIQFPLGLAAGWSFVNWIMTFHAMLLSFEFEGFKAFWIIVTLLVMIGVATAALIVPPIGPDFGVPGIIGWSMIGFIIGENRGLEEGAFATTLIVLTCLAGLGIIGGTIFLGHKEMKASMDSEQKSSRLSFMQNSVEETNQSTKFCNPFANLSAITYGLLLVITSAGEGRDALFEFDLSEIWRRYEGFLTLPIFMLEVVTSVVQLFTGIVVLVQMLPAYTPLVVEESKQCFFIALVGQACWLIAMANEAATLAFLCSAVVLAAFVTILLVQKKNVNDESPEAYWFIRFPLGLAAGWAFITFLMTFQAMLSELNMEGGQAFGIIVAILLMSGVAVGALMFPPVSPDYGFSFIVGTSLIGFALGEHGNIEEGAFLTTIVVITILAGVGVLGYTIFLSYMDGKKSNTNDEPLISTLDDKHYTLAPESSSSSESPNTDATADYKGATMESA